MPHVSLSIRERAGARTLASPLEALTAEAEEVATRLTWRTSNQLTGLRPFSLRRDLRSVVDLVLLAFANEPERGGGQSSQEELRALKRLAPLLWVSSLVSDQTRDFFAGFVWEEDGKVVGNASVSKVGRNRLRWMVGNVAVHPDYRRRGIARQLTLAAIDLARSHGGQLVMLDVRADNKPAYDLYLSLGFKQFAGTTELKLTGWNGASAEASRGWLPAEGDAVSLSFRALSRLQWRPVYELARAATPPVAQLYNPIRQTDYQTGLAQETLNGFTRFLARRKDYGILALDGERPTAYLEISVRGIKLSHRLRTIVHPDYKGKVELALVSKAMDILRYHPWNSIWAEIHCDHLEQAEAFKKCGFKETVTLHRLGLKL